MNILKAAGILLLVLNITLLPGLIQANDDPAASADKSYEEVQKYTPEEFDLLSDEEKKDIYLNQVELLPENFDPTQYEYLFYEKEKETLQE